MERFEKIQYLNQILLDEMPQYRDQAARFPQEDHAQRRLLRSLMNVRPPRPLDQQFLQAQDELLSAEREAKGVVEGDRLPVTPADPRVAIWQGDITRLAVDAIVDADNSALLGCFCPCHGCIDNAIHSAAGLQLRRECNEIMMAQGHPEPAGRAKLTKGYNLPAKFVLHTVDPSSRDGSPEKTGRNWPPVTAPVCFWRQNEAWGASRFAVSPPGSFISPTGRPPRSPWKPSRNFSGGQHPFRR